MSLEELHRPLMFLRCLPGFEGAEVAPLPCFRILLP
jgi:hypothetical protein